MSLENKIAEGKIFVAGKELLQPREIPSIVVAGRTIPEVWENAVLATWEFGTTVPTEYDGQEDPESRDATVMMMVGSPFEEPRIHKTLPVGLDELALYVKEVTHGIRDNRIRTKDHEGWSYSYHDRMKNWPGIEGWERMLKGQEVDLPGIDQLDLLVKKLAVAPHSRRAQAVTWVPPLDAEHHEPPCLQRVWCRIVQSPDGNFLEMNTHWRSRDAFKAAFMNMFAMTELQKILAQKVSDLSGRQINVGRYVDMVDSFHIYGSYERRKEVQLFLKRVQNSPFEKRVFRSDDEVVLQEFAMANEALRLEINK